MRIGLCQQLAGDFLFHCHVAHHYIAGMWGYWRVHSTIQQGREIRNDAMPDCSWSCRTARGRIRRRGCVRRGDRQTVGWFGKQFRDRGEGQTDWRAGRGRRDV